MIPYFILDIWEIKKQTGENPVTACLFGCRWDCKMVTLLKVT